MLIDDFRFDGDWFHCFEAAGCAASGFAMAGLAAAGFEDLGLVTSSLAAVGFKQCQVHHSGTTETTSVTKTPEHNAAKLNVGKVRACLCHFRQMRQSTKF